MNRWTTRGAVMTIFAVLSCDAATVPEVPADSGAELQSVLASGARSDRDALVTFYNATDGPNWTRNDNWLTSAPIDDWYGVDLVWFGTTVSGLRLGDNNLSGSIPMASLILLSDLTHLDLRGNRMRDSIPAGIGALGVTRLNLSDNYLEGEIPAALGQMGDTLRPMTVVDLSDNFLVGSIPPELGNITYDAIGGSTLDLSDNLLTGTIPPELANLHAWRLDLSDNLLTGSIPPELGGLDSLGALDLSRNRLTGAIPAELGNIGEHLSALNLSGNRLGGPIPPELGNLSFHNDNGTVLDLSGNLLSGSIPPALSNLWVETLDISNNLLTGVLPPLLGWPGLRHILDVGDNALTGPLPLSLPASHADREYHEKMQYLRYAGTAICVPAGETMQTWLDSIPLHIGTGLACDPLFGDGFEAGSWGDDNWTLVNATSDKVGTRLRLTNTVTRRYGFAARGHRLRDWDVRVKMGGISASAHPVLVLMADGYRYNRYTFLMGEGLTVDTAAVDYVFAYLDALGGVWRTESGLYGKSHAVPTDTTAVEIAASLTNGRLRVYVGATELINAELSVGLPTALTGYGLASSPTDTVPAVANFDWVEIYGTGLPGETNMANRLAAEMVMGQLTLPTRVTSWRR
ncbi:MAG: hypothetical protein OXI33_00050 [Chloroflexota bacterium]|nr:hypothetical protein [Chloroflexota bacterium]